MIGKRVIFLINSFGGGGAEHSTVNLANALKKRGQEVTIVVSQEGPNIEAIDDGIEIRVGHTVKILHAFFCRRIIKATQLDCIVVCIMPEQLIYGFIATLFTSSKVIGFERNNVFESSKIYSRFKRSKLIGLRALYRFTDYNLAVSEEVRKMLISGRYFSQEKSGTLYSIVNKEQIEEKAGEECAPIGYEFILFVGRLSKLKGVEDLVIALSLIDDKDIKLVLLGEGEEKDAIRLRASNLGLEERVVFLGYQTNPFKFMKRSKLVVLPSYSEGMPNVLVQALAVGSTVISYNCKSGPSEVLEDGRFGRLVEVGNIEQLAESINACLEHRLVYDSSKAVEKFSENIIAEKFLKICQTLI